MTKMDASATILRHLVLLELRILCLVFYANQKRHSRLSPYSLPSNVPCNNSLAILLCLDTWPYHESIIFFILCRHGYWEAIIFRSIKCNVCNLCLFQFGQYTAIQEERAVKFHERNMLSRILREWADYAAEEKMATWNKERQAKQHNTRPVVLIYPALTICPIC